MNSNKISIYLAITILLLFSSNLYSQFANPILIESDTGSITNIITADINNDNLKDIIITRKFSSNNLISYYLNQGNLNFSPEISIATGSSQVTNIAVGDFDNNNWLDIVSIGDATNSVTLHMNSALSFSSQVLDSFTFFESDIGVADIDNDSNLDIVAIGGTTFKVYYNDGMANFTSQTITGPIEDFFDLTISDIDADGFEDVITGGSNISVYKNNNGTLSYDSVRSNQIPSTFNLFVRLVDIDNDGDVDLFSENDNSTGIRWMQNDGNGTFSNLQIIDPSAMNIRSGTLKDFDNDNDLDFIIIKDFNLYLYTNDGFGNFSAPILIQDTQTIISVIESEDLNNDGLEDIIWSADLSIQENNLLLSNEEYIVGNNLIKIYPNPSSENLYLDSPENGVLTILNSKGQIVYKNLPLKKGKNYIKKELVPQLYFFKINLKTNTTITKKVLIK
ncbi:VCBS repeat-containing protein [Winogradskyella psychrotolerans]|uniref:FG-GAP repeat domain-containing protein n=1 Tax=Winogradskyella psychrotolerans TaxID=1344585 RepID=UPI001C0713EF|nr:VCBS repeat-containing protein [Winogradskyella psychrotolerans]MBU2920201.1 VCBS repeat-containing protein [Winogradskyella psychrotolerans]